VTGDEGHSATRGESTFGSPLKVSVSILLIVAIAVAGFWSLRWSRTVVPEPARSLVLDTVPAKVQAQSGRRDWTLYGGDYANRRWSQLSAINRRTVPQLARRFVIPTGAGKKGSLQTTPLVADGVMYVTSPIGHVVAWDLRRGRQVWRFHHLAVGELLCCGPSNRGVALGHGHVYLGTLDAKLIALDAATGAPVWTTTVDSATLGFSLTMAPLVVDSLVIVGTSGAEFGVRGHVSAYRGRDGTLVWRRYTIPSPEEGGWWGRWSDTTSWGVPLGRDLARERADSARYAGSWRTGGGSVWSTPAYDPRSGRLYVAVGNPAPSFDPSQRPGDNLYTESLLALRAATGDIVWAHQFIPHDSWDMDPGSPPLLIPQGDGLAVAEAGKVGHLFVLDADSGRLLARSAPLVPQANLFAPLSERRTVIAPGPNGGVSWSPAAWSPVTGLVYVVALHQPMWVQIEHVPLQRGLPWYGGITGRTERRDEFGTISAVEPASGRIVWQVRTTRPMVGGVLATAGGLIFTGEGDGWFRAYDAATGARVWQFHCEAGVNAPPIAFEVDGEQMIAVAVGGNTQQGFRLGNRVMVFALPRGGR
jgi:PQQ-dependent dehydrogenase (methanol/ethanol family)